MVLFSPWKKVERHVTHPRGRDTLRAKQALPRSHRRRRGTPGSLTVMSRFGNRALGVGEWRRRRANLGWAEGKCIEHAKHIKLLRRNSMERCAAQRTMCRPSRPPQFIKTDDTDRRVSTKEERERGEIMEKERASRWRGLHNLRVFDVIREREENLVC